MRWLVRVLQQVRATAHSWCGWLLFRAGCRLRARGHFERVLQLRGDDFGAYVHLGRIAFAIGDYSGWRRDFEHARRADPARFARLRHPSESWEPRLAGTQCADPAPGNGMSFEGGLRGGPSTPSWRSMLFGPPPLRAGGPHSDGPAADAAPSRDAGLESPPAGPGDGSLARPAASDRSDDCSTAAERRRFRELGPIRSRDIGACDLDELLRRLSG